MKMKYEVRKARRNGKGWRVVGKAASHEECVEKMDSLSRSKPGVYVGIPVK